jgi:rhodanese-related sulfurtransferase
MKRLLILASLTALAVLVLGGCSQPETEVSEPKQEATTQNVQEGESVQHSYMDVSPAEAKKLMEDNSDLVIIDVSGGYAQGHLPGAVNHWLGPPLEKAIQNFDKNGKYLVYCHSDRASIAGAQQLIDAGFKNVYRLRGNYEAWIDAGYDIEKST